jgi:GNAT superfamily N-acetyltransferase
MTNPHADRRRASNRLLAIYLAAAANKFPPDDAEVTLLPAPPGLARAAIFATPRHHIVAADVTSTWVKATLDGTLAAAMSPSFLASLERKTDLHADSIDIVLAASGIDGPSKLEPIDDLDHPRLHRARRCRTDIRAFRTEDAFVVLGRGAAERLEIAIEIDPAARGRGLAREALTRARRLADEGEPIFAQVAPGNVAAVRAFLAAGFRPIGGEVLFFPRIVGD